MQRGVSQAVRLGIRTAPSIQAAQRDRPALAAKGAPTRKRRRGLAHDNFANAQPETPGAIANGIAEDGDETLDTLDVVHIQGEPVAFLAAKL